MPVPYNIDRFGCLDTELNEISFQGAKDRKEAIEICRSYWGKVKGSVLVKLGDKIFICDGIDPTTGRPFDTSVESALRNTFDSYETLAKAG